MASVTDTLIRLDPEHGLMLGLFDDTHSVLTHTRDNHMDLARYRRSLGQDPSEYVKIALSAHFRAMRLMRSRNWRLEQPWVGLGAEAAERAKVAA